MSESIPMFDRFHRLLSDVITRLTEVGYHNFSYKKGDTIQVSMIKVFTNDGREFDHYISVAEMVRDSFYDPNYDGQPGVRFVKRRFFSNNQVGVLGAVRQAHRRSGMPLCHNSQYGTAGMTFQEVLVVSNIKLKGGEVIAPSNEQVEFSAIGTMDVPENTVLRVDENIRYGITEFASALRIAGVENFTVLDLRALFGKPLLTNLHDHVSILDMIDFGKKFGFEVEVIPNPIRQAVQVKVQPVSETKTIITPVVKKVKLSAELKEKKVAQKVHFKRRAVKSIVLNEDISLVDLAQALAKDEIDLVHEMIQQLGTKHHRLQMLSPKYVESYLNKYYPKIKVINRVDSFCSHSIAVVNRAVAMSDFL